MMDGSCVPRCSKIAAVRRSGGTGRKRPQIIVVIRLWARLVTWAMLGIQKIDDSEAAPDFPLMRPDLFPGVVLALIALFGRIHHENVPSRCVMHAWWNNGSITSGTSANFSRTALITYCSADIPRFCAARSISAHSSGVHPTNVRTSSRFNNGLPHCYHHPAGQRDGLEIRCPAYPAGRGSIHHQEESRATLLMRPVAKPMRFLSCKQPASA